MKKEIEKDKVLVATFPKEYIKILTEASELENVSKSEIIRNAIDLYAYVKRTACSDLIFTKKETGEEIKIIISPDLR